MSNPHLDENILDKGIFPENPTFNNENESEILEYIFTRGSSTFSGSTKFFPPEVAKKITQLYGFVRIADNYVDEGKDDLETRNLKLNTLLEIFNLVYKEKYQPKSLIGRFVVVPFANLFVEHEIDVKYVDAFFKSMFMDLEGRSYSTFDDTLDYIYGSAEVIGLIIAKILNLKPESYEYAASLGIAFQLINFIRDISEDYDRKRTYFPKTDLQEFKLNNLSREESKLKSGEFKSFMKKQIARYRKEQSFAAKGLKFLPKSLRVAVKTALDSYNLTANIIEKDPFVIYKKKVKPSKSRIKLLGLINISKINLASILKL